MFKTSRKKSKYFFFATEKDIPELAELIRAVVDRCPDDELSRDILRYHLNSIPIKEDLKNTLSKYDVLCERRNGKISGYAVLSNQAPYSMPVNAPKRMLKIEIMFVHPDFMGKGISRKLVKAANDYAFIHNKELVSSSGITNRGTRVVSFANNYVKKASRKKKLLR